MLDLAMIRTGIIWKYLTIPQRLRLRCVSRFWRDADPEAVMPTSWLRPFPSKYPKWERRWLSYMLGKRFHLIFPSMSYTGERRTSAGDDVCDTCICMNNGTILVWENQLSLFGILDHGHPCDQTEFVWYDKTL